MLRSVTRSKTMLPVLFVLSAVVLNRAFGFPSTIIEATDKGNPPIPWSFGAEKSWDARRGLVDGQDAVCDAISDCTSCFQEAGCGYCGGTGRCLAQASADKCSKGWSDTGICYTSCPADAAPLHEAAGVIQFGAMAPGAVHYIPGESCTFTIWPLPGSGSATSPGAGAGNRRSVMIRLQFEYLDLGPGDTLNIYSNGLDGPKILSIAGSGLGIVNRTITSRSSSVVLRLHAEGPVGGTGFRVYWRVIESSPLDIYLISAIIGGCGRVGTPWLSFGGVAGKQRC